MDFSEQRKATAENEPPTVAEDNSKHEYFMKQALQMVYIPFFNTFFRQVANSSKG